MPDGLQAYRRHGRGDGPPPGARKSALPLTLAPQLATLVSSPPPGEGWIYEAKFDGYRLLARIEGKESSSITRNGHDWTAPRAAGHRARRDGPAALLARWRDRGSRRARSAGLPGAAERLRFAARRPHRILRLRRALLRRLRPAQSAAGRATRGAARGWWRHRPQPRVKFSEDFEASADELLDKACRVGFEGVIGKRRDAAYVSRRSPTWIKLKCKQRQEFVIGGYTAPQGSRSGFGALLLGIARRLGPAALQRQGRHRLRRAPPEQLAGNEGISTSIAAPERALHAGRPTTVQGSPMDEGRTGGQAVFGAWTPKAIREAALSPTVVASKEDRSWMQRLRAGLPHQAAARRRNPAPGEALHRSTALPVTHAERVIDPSTGATKLDLVRHYATVAEAMLPHLAGRPVALLRAPQGLGGEMFFQKHATELEMPHVRVLDPKLDAPNDPLIEIDSVEALLGAAQMNVVEFHTWNASWKSIEKPNRICFDLDPGEGIEWKQIIEATQITHALLDELGLESFLKTSGGKGLHVVVPIAPARLGSGEGLRTGHRGALGAAPSRTASSPRAARRIESAASMWTICATAAARPPWPRSRPGRARACLSRCRWNGTNSPSFAAVRNGPSPMPTSISRPAYRPGPAVRARDRDWPRR